MLGLKGAARKPIRDEAEKPFWISFSDLMTALMVLFLVAMAVALLAATQKVQQVISGPEDHQKKVDACMTTVTAMTNANFPGIEVRGYSIGFGTLALFGKNENVLKKNTNGQAAHDDAANTLRSYVPKILQLTRSPKCESVFKRIIVEGFASRSGTYIYNLNLSLQRAERILCVLLDPNVKDPLSDEDRTLVRNLFLVGGSSFNSLKESDAESQRIELRLEFLGYKEPREKVRDAPLDVGLICPL